MRFELFLHPHEDIECDEVVILYNGIQKKLIKA